MANEEIRVGLIGAGRNTRERHIPGFQEIQGLEIAAVANRSREAFSMSWASWAEVAIRASHRTCLPFSRAATVRVRCMLGHVPMHTAFRLSSSNNSCHGHRQ